MIVALILLVGVILAYGKAYYWLYNDAPPNTPKEVEYTRIFAILASLGGWLTILIITIASGSIGGYKYN